jgi:hypothetical protein
MEMIAETLKQYTGTQCYFACCYRSYYLFNRESSPKLKRIFHPEAVKKISSQIKTSALKIL